VFGTTAEGDGVLTVQGALRRFPSCASGASKAAIRTL